MTWRGTWFRPLLLLAVVVVATAVHGEAGRAAGRLTMTVDDTPARVGQYLALDVEATDLDEEPDLSPLFRDADEAGTTTGTRLTIVTGKLVAIRSWRILLVPRRAGPLVLGPLRAGDVEAPAVVVDVRPAAAWVPAAGDLAGEILATPSAPYVRQAVVLRLVLRHRVPLEGLAFASGVLNAQGLGARVLGAQVLGPPETRPEEGGGYRTQLRFAIQPSASGSLVIPAVAWEARARPDPAEPSVPVHGTLAGTTLTVRPWPQAAMQPFLPARQVRLSESWSKPPSTLAAGEGVTRTILIDAEGITAQDVPEPVFAPTRGLSILPLATERRTVFGPDGPSAHVERRFEVRALSPTPVFADAIRIAWWDVTDDRPREAVLPALRFDVALPGRATASGRDESRREVLRAAAFIALAGIGALLPLLLHRLWRRPRYPRNWRAAIARRDPAALYAALKHLPVDERNRPELASARGLLERRLFSPAGAAEPDWQALRRLRPLGGRLSG